LTDAILLDDFATELRRISGDRSLGSIRHNSLRPPKSKADYDDPVVRYNDSELRTKEHETPVSSAPKYPEPVKQKSSQPDGDSILQIEDVGGLAS
jgi:hypothetical protein